MGAQWTGLKNPSFDQQPQQYSRCRVPVFGLEKSLGGLRRVNPARPGTKLMKSSLRFCWELWAQIWTKLHTHCSQRAPRLKGVWDFCWIGAPLSLVSDLKENFFWQNQHSYLNNNEQNVVAGLQGVVSIRVGLRDGQWHDVIKEAEKEEAGQCMEMAS